MLAGAGPRPHRPRSRALAKALAQARYRRTRQAFYVHEIGAESPVVAAGAERALNPASIIKLVTTYAGLELLGPAYTWLHRSLRGRDR